MTEKTDLHIDWQPEDEIFLSGTDRNLSENFGSELSYQVKTYINHTLTPAKNIHQEFIDEFKEHYKLYTAKLMTKVWVGITSGFTFRDIANMIKKDPSHVVRLYQKAANIRFAKKAT